MLNNLLGKQVHTLEISLKILCDVFKVVTFMFFYTAGVSLKQNKKTLNPDLHTGPNRF